MKKKKPPSKITISFRVLKQDVKEIYAQVRSILNQKGYRLYEKQDKKRKSKTAFKAGEIAQEFWQQL